MTHPADIPEVTHRQVLIGVKHRHGVSAANTASEVSKIVATRCHVGAMCQCVAISKLSTRSSKQARHMQQEENQQFAANSSIYTNFGTTHSDRHKEYIKEQTLI